MTSINTITTADINAEMAAMDPTIEGQIAWFETELAQTEKAYNDYILNGGHDFAVIDDFEWSIQWLRSEMREWELALTA